MNNLDQTLQTQLNNIQTKTGKSLDDLADIVKRTGLTQHGEIRSMFLREFGLGYGDANILAHAIIESAFESAG
ncbi:MAG: DUF4287 domain-containing protein [Chloroflexi bacterium]|nr:DUF4287 domain-containing protein [Chloroflexota bacterium]